MQDKVSERIDAETYEGVVLVIQDCFSIITQKHLPHSVDWHACVKNKYRSISSLFLTMAVTTETVLDSNALKADERLTKNYSSTWRSFATRLQIEKQKRKTLLVNLHDIDIREDVIRGGIPRLLVEVDYTHPILSEIPNGTLLRMWCTCR